jgi:Protein of unknown function, DUF547
MKRLIFLVLLNAMAYLPELAVTAQAQELAQIFDKHNQNSTAKIDHAPWARALKTYLQRDKTGLNRFKYKAVSDKNHKALKAYLTRLQNTRVTNLNRNEQYAFWINLYNALTIDIVLDHYPVLSIRNISISPGLFAKGPWGRKLVMVEGETLSLDDIEHEILRKIWRDKRIHYAVNCAAISCPNLASQVYTGQNVNRLLEAGAVAYINHPRGVRLEKGRLIVSKIYQWYAKDFGNTAQLISHLRHYANSRLAGELAKFDHISSYEYDWSLNE